ncbi:hypothetical protein [Halorubellus sp. PRR65]|uniref:hypothetical protein n=1 Tax=Halorubellus sp. PRR65 TaxID=3098148 RepID=UPI002B25EDE7|nr:hypothetical protein [Halorubellus sp. PRR65]
MVEPGLTEALSAVLGVAFGALMVAYPGVVLAVQTAGTRPDRQPGPTGDAPTGSSVWETLIRVAGVGFVLAGLYFASLFIV